MVGCTSLSIVDVLGDAQIHIIYLIVKYNELNGVKLLCTLKNTNICFSLKFKSADFSH